MTAVRSERLTGTDVGAIRTGLAELLPSDRAPFGVGSRVLVVPDVHYPYHPSTGLVTNPDVVRELVDYLDAEVVIGVSASEHVDTGRVRQYLGYERLAERTRTPLVELDDADRIERQVDFAGGSVSLSVPRPLLDDDVVVVPTARRSQRSGVAAGMVTLARAVTDAPTREEILAAVRTCWPVLSILDATFAYSGEPRRMAVLAASDDVVALSRKAADLLDVDVSDVSHLAPRRALPSPLRGMSNSLPGVPPAGGDGVIEKGYRLYARVTGDLVPPQMLARGDNE